MKRHDLREVREPNKKSIHKEGIFIYSHTWEAWGEDKSKQLLQTLNNPKSLNFTQSGNDFNHNYFIAKGSLRDCIEALSYVISMELKAELMSLERQLGTKYKDTVQDLTRHVRQHQAKIRKVCWETGEYFGDGWFIRSSSTRLECECSSQNRAAFNKSS